MKVALGVTGCIAAYKAIEVMRGLQKEAVSVQAVLTRSAGRFVTPLTFESLSGQKAITHMFGRGTNLEIGHIRLAQEIRLLAVVPATANILGKFAHGIADDFLSTLYLSCPAPVLLAPAMNVEMWNHPAVQENVGILKRRGHVIVDPEPGRLACGMEGMGRLADVDDIVSCILGLLKAGASLNGLNVLVTAGPTLEDIDPVRFISNRSSGKMGYAIAQAAYHRGARVTLVSGPTNLRTAAQIKTIPVRSAAEMKEAVLSLYPDMDVVIKAAAVSDYRPAGLSPQKMKKNRRDTTLSLVPTEDILALLGREKKHQILVGFAAETESLVENAGEKLRQKNLDLIVANDVSAGVFGDDFAEAQFITSDGITALEAQPKLSIAHRILDEVLKLRDQKHLHRSRPEAERPV